MRIGYQEFLRADSKCICKANGGHSYAVMPNHTLPNFTVQTNTKGWKDTNGNECFYHLERKSRKKPNTY